MLHCKSLWTNMGETWKYFSYKDQVKLAQTSGGQAVGVNSSSTISDKEQVWWGGWGIPLRQCWEQSLIDLEFTPHITLRGRGTAEMWQPAWPISNKLANKTDELSGLITARLIDVDIKGVRLWIRGGQKPLSPCFYQNSFMLKKWLDGGVSNATPI